MSDIIAVALVAAGSGLIGALVSGFFGRRKSGADAAATLTSASIELVETLRKEVDELRTEQGVLKVEIESLKTDLLALEEVANVRQIQITKLKARIDEANRIIDAQEKRIVQLEDVLRQHGISPYSDKDGEIGGVVF